MCFFPSYDYERKVHTHWSKTGVLERITRKKKVSHHLSFFPLSFPHNSVATFFPRVFPHNSVSTFFPHIFSHNSLSTFFPHVFSHNSVPNLFCSGRERNRDVNDDRDMETIADEFGVSTYVITNQIENRSRIMDACATRSSERVIESIGE